MKIFIIVLFVLNVKSSFSAIIIERSYNITAKDTIIVLKGNEQPINITQLISTTTGIKINNDMFVINNCYIVNGNILLPLKVKNKIITNKPDACKNMYTTLAGKICAANGCITGNGSGLCSKIKYQKIKYTITIKLQK